MLHRATERWDANDDHAVFLQASLFSYQSVEHEQSNEDVALELECDLERRREALHPKQAQRQHTQLPVEPLGAPSELRRCFEAVNAAITVPPSKSRVRARLCTSANADISVQHVTLVGQGWQASARSAVGVTCSQKWLCKRSALRAQVSTR